MAAAVPVIALLLLVFGGILLFAAYRLGQSIRPAGHVDYVDQGVEVYIPHGPLIDGRRGLSAQPDGLYRLLTEQHLVPYYTVDSPSPESVTNDLRFMVALSCLLAEVVYDQTVPYGVIRYSDRDMTINWTPGLARELDDLLEMMHDDASEAEVDRSHPDPGVCRYCVVREYCDQVLE